MAVGSAGRGRSWIGGGSGGGDVGIWCVEWKGLLPAAEIDEIVNRAPGELIDNQRAFANGFEIPAWHDFIEMFTPEDAADEVTCGHHRVPRLARQFVQLGTARVTKPGPEVAA